MVGYGCGVWDVGVGLQRGMNQGGISGLAEFSGWVMAVPSN